MKEKDGSLHHLFCLLDEAGETESVLRANGKNICVSVEDVRAVIITKKILAQLVQASSDQLGGVLDDCLDYLKSASLSSLAVLGSDMWNEITGDGEALVLSDVDAKVDVFWPLDNQF